MTQEEYKGKTPAGGVRSVIYYQDKNGQPAEKDSAIRAEIVEFDAQDNAIYRTYMTRKTESEIPDEPAG